MSTTGVKTQDQQDYLSAQFEKAAIGTAKMCAVSLHDVRGAYENKKSSLTTLFDAASTAKSDRGGWLGWSILWALTIPPIMVYTVYKAVESHIDYANFKKEVVREVSAFREKEGGETVTPEVKPSPFGARIVR